MEINDLYAELGRELRKWRDLDRSDDLLQSEYHKNRKAIREKMANSRQRIAELEEAVKQSEAGKDPLLAKLTAKEDFEASGVKARSQSLPSYEIDLADESICDTEECDEDAQFTGGVPK